MAVVMMVLFALNHRNHAAVRHFAHRVLELNRRMIDSKVAQQALFYVT